MYKDFYHIKTEIFTTLPQLGAFFDSEIHKGAWNYLLYGVRSQEPYMLVTGDYGMGKTLLALRLVGTLKEENAYPFVYIPSATFSYTKILREIVEGIGLVVQKEDDSSLQSLIYEYIKKEGKHIYLIVDEAQEFDPSRLNKLRALVNFNHDGVFFIHLILFAHVFFLHRLYFPTLIPLGQRIRRKYHLTPFNFTETKEYIYFQLFNSGASGSPYFSEEAIRQIFIYSGGIPRFINTICDASLLIGASQGLEVIERSVIEEAVKSLNLPNEKRNGYVNLPLDKEKLEHDEEETKTEERGVFYKLFDYYLLLTRHFPLPFVRNKFQIILCLFILLSAFLLGLFLKDSIFSVVSSWFAAGDNNMATVQSLGGTKQEKKPILEEAKEFKNKEDAEVKIEKMGDSDNLALPALDKEIHDRSEDNTNSDPEVDTSGHSSELTLDFQEGIESNCEKKWVNHPYSLILSPCYFREGALKTVEDFKHAGLSPLFLGKVNQWWWVYGPLSK
ncbi:MAG: hypothetical protein B5M53_09540 [Candidatus Cloacimonas sp. 4484_209]|nr:MAG: hypothetical protein B5M53_09540 [Candidatus Cloacimonas sp. 4484_209]